MQIKNSFSRLLFSLLTSLSLALISVNYSIDIPNYYKIFNDYQDLDIAFLITNWSFTSELFFALPIALFGQSFNYNELIGSITIFSVFIKIKYLYAFDRNLKHCLLYIIMYSLLFDATLVRTGFATTLIIISLFFFKEKKMISSFFFILWASQLHLTAILYLIIFPIYKSEKLKKLIHYIFLISPLAYILNTPLSDYLFLATQIITDKYLEYNSEGYIEMQNNTGLYIPFATIFYLILIFLYINTKKAIFESKFLSTIYSICALGSTYMWLFFDRVAPATRLGEIMLFPITILISEAVENNTNNARILNFFAFSLLLSRVYYLFIKPNL
jgi:hypothetical protein